MTIWWLVDIMAQIIILSLVLCITIKKVIDKIFEEYNK